MMLGFASTGGDGLRLYRELDRKDLQTKKHLRSAAGHSLIVQSLFVTVGLLSGRLVGTWTMGQFFTLLVTIVGGLVFGYTVLLWMTRPQGWYGLD